MTYHVTLADGHRFAAPPEASILDASRAAGLRLEHSCDTGRCGSCRARLLKGQVTALKDTSGLSTDEQRSGWVLTCAHAAVSDLQLDTRILEPSPVHAAKSFPARIERLALLAPDVLQVTLRLPPTAGFQFQAGQHIELCGPGNVKRRYSIASPSTQGTHLELHIRRVSGGALSKYWFEEARLNDLLRLRGPLGSFSLRPLVRQHLVLLATGTGVAPLLSMLGELACKPAAEQPLSTTLYWGGRKAEDLYTDPVRTGPAALRYVPVLSRGSASWLGARGHVQEVLLAEALRAERANLTQTSVYACGSAPMIHDARAVLVAHGLPPGQFHADAFVSSA